MKKKRLLTLLLLPAALPAQPLPVTGVFEVPRPIFAGRPAAEYAQASPAAAALAGGGFAVAWTAAATPAAGFVALDVVGRLLTADGEPARGFFVGGSSDPRRVPQAPVIAADGGGGFTVAWPQSQQILVRRYAPRAQPRGPAAPLPGAGASRQERPALAVNPGGAYALAWLEETGIHTQAFTRNGLPLGTEVALGLPPGPRPAPVTGIDGTGRRVVAWIAEGMVWTQRLDRDGSPLGPRFTVGPSGGGGVALAMAADGTWTVAWDGPSFGLLPHPLFLRRYAPEGFSLDPTVEAGLAAGFQDPVLSADRHGNFALSWREGNALTVRLFNRALVAQGEPLLRPDARSGGAALGDDGRLLVVWSGSRLPATAAPRARLWQARRDAEPCAFNGTFLCDTGNDGGAADETLDFGHSGDLPLLGDLDGDGRDDPCVYRNGRFLCDARQDGGAAESRARFSRSQSLPLLGDLDGDGRDDPCLRRGNRFLCDLDRDGTEDLDLALGDRQDPGLLGDVDGDGDDDPCFYRSGSLHCDTAHDGLPPDWAFHLGDRIPAARAAWTPLLGDLDGDGRDDLCLAEPGGSDGVADPGRLVCWLQLENGAAPEPAVDRRLTFAQPGAPLLLGDVDRF